MKKQVKEKKAAAPDGARLRVGIAISRYYADIADELLAGAKRELEARGVKPAHIFTIETFGSFELPLACQKLAKRKKVQVLIALGCVVKGETKHDEYIAHAVASGLTRLSLDTGIPVGLGILTVHSMEQARARASSECNYGANAAVAALSLALA